MVTVETRGWRGEEERGGRSRYINYSDSKFEKMVTENINFST